MLSQCLCQFYKSLVLRNLKLNSIDVAPLARRIHSSAKKLSDCGLKEQTIQKSETEELPQSMKNHDGGRLHIPVMLEEVVNCLSPQPGQLVETMNVAFQNNRRRHKTLLTVKYWSFVAEVLLELCNYFEDSSL